MQVVDLIGGEPGATSVIRQKPARCQEVVVCKTWKPAVYGVEVLPTPRLAPELSCCLQDPADSVFGPERAAAGDSARPWPGAVRDTAASNPDGESATSPDCRGTPGGIPDPRRYSGGYARRDDGAGNRGCRTPTAPAGISTVRRTARTTGIAVRQSGRASRGHAADGDRDRRAAQARAPGPPRISTGGHGASMRLRRSQGRVSDQRGRRGDSMAGGGLREQDQRGVGTGQRDGRSWHGWRIPASGSPRARDDLPLQAHLRVRQDYDLTVRLELWFN